MRRVRLILDAWAGEPIFYYWIINNGHYRWWVLMITFMKVEIERGGKTFKKGEIHHSPECGKRWYIYYVLELVWEQLYLLQMSCWTNVESWSDCRRTFCTCWPPRSLSSLKMTSSRWVMIVVVRIRFTVRFLLGTMFMRFCHLQSRVKHYKKYSRFFIMG